MIGKDRGVHREIPLQADQIEPGAVAHQQLDRLERIEVEEEDFATLITFPPAPRSEIVAKRSREAGMSFGPKHVLQQSELTIERGDKIALVGRNGRRQDHAGPDDRGTTHAHRRFDPRGSQRKHRLLRTESGRPDERRFHGLRHARPRSRRDVRTSAGHSRRLPVGARTSTRRSRYSPAANAHDWRWPV